jgi:hypothetical protein
MACQATSATASLHEVLKAGPLCRQRILDLFVIIFQIPGSDCKFLDYGLILEKPRGLNAKCLKLYFPRIVFLKETRRPPKPWSTVDRPWTMALSSTELRPPAAPVSTGAGQGAGEEEWGAGSAVGGSPGHVWRCGGRASRRRGGSRKNLMVRHSGAGEEKEGVW